MDIGLRDAFAEGTVQLFVGSGLSSDVFPSRDHLRDRLLGENIYVDGTERTLREIINENQSQSLEDAAEFFELYAGSESLLEIIRQTYGGIKRSKGLHRDLWRLPNVRMIYTTNYDCLIEDAIGRPLQPPVVIRHIQEIGSTPANSRVVFKLHGCARKQNAQRNEFVITRNDYINYSRNRTAEESKILVDLIEKQTFLFLGYSLADPSIRHIIAEANAIAGPVKAYAVMQNPPRPEIRYWQNQHVTIINSTGEEFLKKVFKIFPLDATEWSEKRELRIEEKQIIARLASDVIKENLTRGNINIILDSGSSCFYLAREILEEVKSGIVPAKLIRIVTNSSPIITEFSENLRNKEGGVEVICTSGTLRYHTQAIIPTLPGTASEIVEHLTEAGPKRRTIAFLGASAIDNNYIKTRTSEEVEIKKAFIELADEVYVLADHSKFITMPEGKVIDTLSDERIHIINDRKGKI